MNYLTSGLRVCGLVLILTAMASPVNLSKAATQTRDTPLKKDLTDLWDGSWLEQNLGKNLKEAELLDHLNTALAAHRSDFNSRSAVDREWQLAEIRSSLTRPDPSLKSRFPFIYKQLLNLADNMVENYTRQHEELFKRDTEWERLRSRVFIDFGGENLRSGQLLASAISYMRERKPDAAPAEERKKEVFSIIDRRIQDYLFAFNNGTASMRRQLYTLWSQNSVSLQPTQAWDLSLLAANDYETYKETYLKAVAKLYEDLEYAFKNPKFITRRGISPAVSQILQLLSANYFEFETYSRWFGQNEQLMNEALVIVDMRTRATPHEVVKLDPLTLKPTDLNEALQKTQFIETVTEKRIELLMRYIAIREEVGHEINQEIITRKAELSPEEEEVLWQEYEKMKELTRASSYPKQVPDSQ